MNSSLLLAIATSLLTHVPIFLVWLVGAVVAIVRRNVSRRVTGFLIGGLAAHMLQAVVGTGMSIALPFQMRERGMTMAQVSTYLMAWSVVWSLISAVAWAFVLLAVFVDREPAST